MILGKPTLFIEPGSIAITCKRGTDANDQTFQVWNSGNGIVNYSVSDTADWLSCTPQGSTISGYRSTITVIFKTSNLSPGEYDEIITIASTDSAVMNSPQKIPVHLSVKGGGGGGSGCFISSTTAAVPGTRVLSFIVMFVMIVGTSIYRSHRVSHEHPMTRR